jgi:hypothetical protein
MQQSAEAEFLPGRTKIGMKAQFLRLGRNQRRPVKGHQESKCNIRQAHNNGRRIGSMSEGLNLSGMPWPQKMRLNPQV